ASTNHSICRENAQGQEFLFWAPLDGPALFFLHDHWDPDNGGPVAILGSTRPRALPGEKTFAERAYTSGSCGATPPCRRNAPAGPAGGCSCRRSARLLSRSVRR